jgi:hypothetical protein
MKIVTPIAPINGRADVFSNALNPNADGETGKSRDVVAVAIVIDDDIDRPYYVVNVNYGNDWYPAYSFGVDATPGPSPWDNDA